MCEECRTGICAFFDALVDDYHRDFPPAIPRQEDLLTEAKRPKFMPMDVSNAKDSAATKNNFSQMVYASDEIGLRPVQFLTELFRRSGFSFTIVGWMDGAVPDSLGRLVILTAAEKVLRKRGARPRAHAARPSSLAQLLTPKLRPTGRSFLFIPSPSAKISAAGA